MTDVPKPVNPTELPGANPNKDTAPPTAQLQADSSVPRGASGTSSGRQTDAQVAGKPVTTPIVFDSDPAVDAQIKTERAKWGPSWTGPNYFSDAYDNLNKAPQPPVPLSPTEQKIADELLSTLKTAREGEQPIENDGGSAPWNTPARLDLNKIIEKTDAATINKIIPTVNEGLAHSDLTPSVRLATADNGRKGSPAEVVLGVKSLSSKNGYLLNYYVGREKSTPKWTDFLP